MNKQLSLFGEEEGRPQPPAPYAPTCDFCPAPASSYYSIAGHLNHRCEECEQRHLEQAVLERLGLARYRRQFEKGGEDDGN